MVLHFDGKMIWRVTLLWEGSSYDAPNQEMAQIIATQEEIMGLLLKRR